MAVDPFTPGFRFERYEIVEQLGEGGMGAVWKARHLKLQKSVVIKTLKLDLAKSAQARGRFLREGEAASKIRHPNVVEIFDVGELDGVPYLVMELLEGSDFQQLLDQRGALNVMEVADIMVPVCAAVSAAHDAGVIHRDLKPQNIFLARGRDRGMQPKVLDFGISRVLDDDRNVHTATSALLGTPRYMSPEQARGAKHVDLRSDQYSLGVMLYQAATGRLPIDESVLYEILRRVVHGEYERPRVFRPDLPEHFEAIILRAMSLRPDARFPSVRALGAALLPYVSDRTRVLFGDSFHGGDTLPLDVVAAPLQVLPRASEVAAPTGFAPVSSPPTRDAYESASRSPPVGSMLSPAHAPSIFVPDVRHGQVASVSTTMDAAREVDTLPVSKPRSRRWLGAMLLACLGLATCVGVVMVALTSSPPAHSSETANPALVPQSQRPTTASPPVTPTVNVPHAAPAAAPPIVVARPTALQGAVAPTADVPSSPRPASPARVVGNDRRGGATGRTPRQRETRSASPQLAPMVLAPAQTGGHLPTTSGGLAVD